VRNWEIKSRSRSCCFCETSFELGQSYHCLLSLGGEEPIRSDFCERCWREKDLDKSRGEEGVAYWRASFHQISRRKETEDPIEKDLVQHLLDKYINSEEPEHINLCYILALLQERKKTLVVRQMSRDEEGNRFTVYEHRERGDTFLVRDPELSLAQAETVEVEIKALLEKENGDESAEETSGGESEGEENKMEKEKGNI